MHKRNLTVLVAALVSAMAWPVQADEKPARGKVIQRLDTTALSMGEMCVALDGSIYTENVARRGIEALKLSPSGDVIWRRAILSDTDSLSNSRYGACATSGALYGVHGSSLEGGKISNTQARVVRLSTDGVIEWKRDLSVPGCDTLLFAIEQDFTGQYVVGGSVDNCIGTKGKRGYIARLALDGTLLGMTFVDGLESVRHLASTSSLLLAAGPAEYGTAVLGFGPGGVRRWGRWDEQIGLHGEIEGLVVGAGGIYLCGQDFDARQVQLIRIDEAGNVISNWRFGNRTTSLGMCFARSSQQSTLALVTVRPSSDFLEIVRLGHDGSPRKMAPLLDDSELSRGFSLSPDGQMFYLGGTPKGQGPRRPFIARYALSEAATAVSAACLSPEDSARFAQRTQQVTEALRKAYALQASQIEPTLASRGWTPEQKAEFRANLPAILEDTSTERSRARALEVVSELRTQLNSAAGPDCESIKFSLGLKLDSLQADADRTVKYVDRYIERIFMRAKPAGAPATAAEISTAQMQWTRAIQQRVRRKWQMPANTPEEARCTVEITLLPDGGIQGVKVLQSSGHEDFNNSVVAAVNAMGRLPMPELRGVFSPQISLVFSKK